MLGAGPGITNIQEEEVVLQKALIWDQRPLIYTMIKDLQKGTQSAA